MRFFPYTRSADLPSPSPLRQSGVILKMMNIVRDVVPPAILAPSAHNTQPWLFRVSNNSLAIFVDWRRHLEVSDPTCRELYISLGCAIFNAKVAAAYSGFSASLTYFPSGEEKGQPAARLDFVAGGADSRLASLLPAIVKRRTNRSMYDGQPLTDAMRQDLHGVQNSNVIHIEDRGAIAKLAEISAAATYSTLSRPDFKRELSKWVRNSFTRRPDGMPGYAMGMPAAASLLAPVMVRIAPIHKQEAPKVQKQIESTSAVAVIVTSADTPTDWLKAGEWLEQLWLEATAANLAAAPLAAAIEAGEDFRRRVQETVGTNQFPQAILRLGRSAGHDLKATPRRSVADCLQR